MKDQQHQFSVKTSVAASSCLQPLRNRGPRHHQLCSASSLACLPVYADLFDSDHIAIAAGGMKKAAGSSHWALDQRKIG